MCETHDAYCIYAGLTIAVAHSLALQIFPCSHVNIAHLKLMYLGHSNSAGESANDWLHSEGLILKPSLLKRDAFCAQTFQGLSPSPFHRRPLQSDNCANLVLSRVIALQRCSSAAASCLPCSAPSALVLLYCLMLSMWVVTSRGWLQPMPTRQPSAPVPWGASGSRPSSTSTTCWQPMCGQMSSPALPS